MEEKTEETELLQATGSGRPAFTGRPTRPRRPDDRRPPDVRDIGNRTKIPEVREDTGRPVPPEPPDVRCPADDRHLSAYSVRARGPCIPFAPHLPLGGHRLYKLLHLHHFRVSNGLAHMRDRALLIHPGSTPRERPRPLYGEDPPWIQDP